MRNPDQSGGRTPSQQSPELRASDAERDRAIELLQQHAASGRLTPSELDERTENACAAKTCADLAALLQDLPTSATGQPAGPGKARRWFVAILGRPQRRGRFRLRGRAIALSVLAAPDIDLCNADVEGSELVIYAFSLLGGPDIYVADSMKVEMSGFSSLVGNELEGSQRPADPDAPVIWIRAYCLFGGCTVWRLPPHLRAVPYRAARRAAKKLTAGSARDLPS
jgi:Domain of unknown function (DUF1707)